MALSIFTVLCGRHHHLQDSLVLPNRQASFALVPRHASGENTGFPFSRAFREPHDAVTAASGGRMPAGPPGTGRAVAAAAFPAEAAVSG